MKTDRIAAHSCVAETVRLHGRTGISMRPIAEIAALYGLQPDDIELHGRYKAKIPPEPRRNSASARLGKYILVTAITPTPLGEGKTVSTIGLAMGLHHRGRKVLACLRQPSMGPMFGVKGGGCGGGRAQLQPADDINFHLTGDMHAVGAATNLLAAMIDSHLHHGNALAIDADSITWRRVVDMNDRALRRIRVGLGGKENGPERETGFEITPASEVMAILALSRDVSDMRRRMGKITFGRDHAGKPVTAEDLEIAGAMAMLVREAVKPTLVQTAEGSGCLIHTGPFANIATGNSSVIADAMALRLADYVVTEAGFGADMGAEKFFNIKCRASGLKPDAAVLVATIRGLKAHSGRFTIKAGRELPPELLREDVDALETGSVNLAKQIANVRAHGVPVVVAINRMPTDTPAEMKRLAAIALASGALAAEVSDVFTHGGAGGEALAASVEAAAASPSSFQHLYALEWDLRRKIETLATRLYGAASVVYSPAAAAKLDEAAAWGWQRMPVCMAKTQLSLSHDPALRGAPDGYAFEVNDMRVMTGAEYVVPMAGGISTMPGLGKRPAGQMIDIDDGGNIIVTS